jgi:hypothetical protein
MIFVLQEQKFSTLTASFSNFMDKNPIFAKEPHQNLGNVFSTYSQESFANPNSMTHGNFRKFCQIPLPTSHTSKKL